MAMNKTRKSNAGAVKTKKGNSPSGTKSSDRKASIGGAGSNPISTFEDEDMYQEPIKKVVRPSNQLQLSEAEMKEEHTRVLTANDPNGEWRPLH
ncbi:unnamed protein product [Choristocarpus tenellus]